MLLIAIVDDTPQDALQLRALVENYLALKNEAARIRVYHDGVEMIRAQEDYDIVFLDIHMDKLNGLEVAHFLRKINKNSILIFVTYMAQMAIRGYEVDAIDFILKPSDQASINRVMDKALERIESRSGTLIALKVAKELISISSNKIYFVEVYDHDLIYHTEDGDYRVRGQLSEVRKKLDEKQFILSSRSYLVNLRHVISVHDDYLLCGGGKVPLSQARRKEIESRFISYLGENL